MTETSIRTSPVLKLINVIHYEVGWFACVLGAGNGLPWIGPAIVALLVAFDLATSPQPGRELAFVAAAAALGFGLDSGQAALGAFSFAGQIQYPWLSPPWMIALWALFATMVHSALSWLQGRYVLGAMLGAVGGPLAYYGGAALGPIVLSTNLPYAFVVVAIAWAVATPALLWLFSRIGPQLPPQDAYR